MSPRSSQVGFTTPTPQTGHRSRGVPELNPARLHMALLSASFSQLDQILGHICPASPLTLGCERSGSSASPHPRHPHP